MNDILIIILFIIHFTMTTNLFIYLFADHLKIVGKNEAYEAIFPLIVISNIWIIYWCWFVYDDIKTLENTDG